MGAEPGITLDHRWCGPKQQQMWAGDGPEQQHVEKSDGQIFFPLLCKFLEQVFHKLVK